MEGVEKKNQEGSLNAIYMLGKSFYILGLGKVVKKNAKIRNTFQTFSRYSILRRTAKTHIVFKTYRSRRASHIFFVLFLWPRNGVTYRHIIYNFFAGFPFIVFHQISATSVCILFYSQGFVVERHVVVCALLGVVCISVHTSFST